VVLTGREVMDSRTALQYVRVTERAAQRIAAPWKVQFSKSGGELRRGQNVDVAITRITVMTAASQMPTNENGRRHRLIHNRWHVDEDICHVRDVSAKFAQTSSC
jgi:hypothetical protein